MTKEYYKDAVKLIEAIQEREDCISEDEINTLSPTNGQTIIEQLEKNKGVIGTFDGWFVENIGSLKQYYNLCMSELIKIDGIEKDLEIKEKTLHYTKLDNIRGWIALVLSILSLGLSIWAFCRTF